MPSLPPPPAPMGQWVPPPGWLPYAYPPVAAPYKGARYGRPASGPGSLASPGRRFGARVLDGLLIGMVFITLAALALVLAIPHIGKVFPDTSYDRADDNRIPGFVWLELLFLAVQGVTTIVGVLYEAWVTAATGRTLGKRWLRIRAVGVDGSALGTGKSFGRAALYAASGLLGWVGLINVLWCLWDGDRQCVHDKIVQTLVVND